MKFESAAAWIGCAFFFACGAAQGKSLFVSADASSGGDGSERAPFNSLEAVERASMPGDEIVVLSSPLSVPPLDGGIALKPGQKLFGRKAPAEAAGDPHQAARITNSTAARHSGDAVVLADQVEVANLMIVASYRGGIYGENVGEADIHDNDLSHTNTSCTPGFYVYFPGNKPLLPNGWAAIMVDESQGAASLSILNNHVHDGACSDGIDVRATGRAHVAARVSHNELVRLAQGPAVRSVLAIGLQTADEAVLTVESAYNSETYIGSPKADCEGLFTNQTGGSLTWNVDHNTFAHGIGGVSCNGAEFYTVTGTGPATTNLYISHSSFVDDPGDMIEEDNGGDAGSAMNLTLDDVTVRHTTLEKHLPPEARFITVQHMDNLGRCMDQYSWGHRTVNNLRVINSGFYDCAGDGIGSDVNGGIYEMWSSSEKSEKTLDLGDGAGDSLSIDVENSTIQGAQQYALHFTNHVAMSDLTIRVENSRLGGASGPATLAFDQDGSTQHADIDLGGGAADSPGKNCITGAGAAAMEVSGYEVHAQADWWGRAQGPRATEISATNGHLDTTAALRNPPLECRGAGPLQHP